MKRSVMLLLSVMTVSGLPDLSSFTKISLPFTQIDEEERDDLAPYMDYDNTQEDDDDYDYDYDDYNDNDDVSNRMEGRLRQQIKSCEFIDLTALGPICNTGKKIKYYKEKTNPRPKHSIFWDGLTGHTILAVHSGPQWHCCQTRTNVTLAVAATCTLGRVCPV
eukprot:TRINITY_DN9319_c0_g1_i1.p1 TRINITY_DN9319_c0_g1~~TRINITY_DN9319_c0_g1_i1.p1  ORF type:complete len:163 (+),score=29.12 TRINITY_DN9319_c0_g1_i1:30-518(+)